MSDITMGWDGYVSVTLEHGRGRDGLHVKGPHQDGLMSFI